MSWQERLDKLRRFAADSKAVNGTAAGIALFNFLSPAPHNNAPDHASRSNQPAVVAGPHPAEKKDPIKPLRDFAKGQKELQKERDKNRPKPPLPKSPPGAIRPRHPGTNVTAPNRAARRKAAQEAAREVRRNHSTSQPQGRTTEPTRGKGITQNPIGLPPPASVSRGGTAVPQAHQPQRAQANPVDNGLRRGNQPQRAQANPVDNGPRRGRGGKFLGK